MSNTAYVVPFEKRRFRSAAEHYLKGRPAYAEALFERVALLTDTGRQDAVLDLGCGPGQIARGFVPYAGQVTAIDPEPEMLRIAAAAAEAAGQRIRFIEGSSFDLTPELGSFRLVAIGRAFHWMDRRDTLARLDRMIVPGGAIALFSDKHPDLPQNAWRKVYDAVLDKYSAEDSARRLRKSNEFGSHETVLLASPFSRLERIGVIEERRTPIADFDARLLSLSSVSRDKIGDIADEMIAEFRAEMAPYVAGGVVAEVVESQALIARRPPR
ncbi:MAG TPA: class I SAM-dependent methyltransferase [Dongiaceae bacterium]|jgi:SAM-dependent methyltransferase|nr:class I SAM-dependent methyltransferase [Dongiaceae bacterium]